MEQRFVYLDYAATTPVAESVAAQMNRYLTVDGMFGNPAARTYRLGWQAEEAVDIARNQIADLVSADPREIIFTSGATESNNLAIKGAVAAYGDKGRHIVTVCTEHKAVLDTCGYLQQQGFDVTYLKVSSDGLIDLDELAAVIRRDTVLVSVMHVNNETGVIQDISGISEICAQKGVLLHVDAAQSAGKLPIDLTELKIDLMSFSAHKVYGPKGIGALYVRRRPAVKLTAQIHGGGHERGMRSGTLATHQIVGMGAAFELAQQTMQDEQARLCQLRDSLWHGLRDLKGIVLNGHEQRRLYNILNVSFDGVDGESLINALPDLALSSGSACTSASMEPSFVLTAMGRSAELAHSGIRMSVGRYTTAPDIDYAVTRIRNVVSALQPTSV